MTTQVADTFRYQGESFDLLDTSAGVLFVPEFPGVFYYPPCTACLRGYVAGYALHDRSLALDSFQVQLEERGDPTMTEDLTPVLHGVRSSVPENSNFGDWFYKDLAMTFDYSGGILIGRQYLREHRIYLAPHAWNFQILIELVFEKGRLVEELDHSERVAEVRGRILAEGKEQPGFWKETREWMHGFLRVRYRMGAF